MHDHNPEVQPRKRAKGSEAPIVKQNKQATVVDSIFSKGENSGLKRKRTQGSEAYIEKEHKKAAMLDPTFAKGGGNALGPLIRYMLFSLADASSKHPGMAKSTFPLTWLGHIGGKCEESEISFGDLAGKINFIKGDDGRKGVSRKLAGVSGKVQGNIGRRSHTDWAKVAAESRKKQLTAASVKQKYAQNCNSGEKDGSAGRSPIIGSKPVEAGASSSLESECSNRINLDTTLIEMADPDIEEEVVDGFLFQASKTMFPLEEVEHNQLVEGEEDRMEAQELHNLEARFGIEVLSFKERRCSLSLPRSAL